MLADYSKNWSDVGLRFPMPKVYQSPRKVYVHRSPSWKVALPALESKVAAYLDN